MADDTALDHDEEQGDKLNLETGEDDTNVDHDEEQGDKLNLETGEDDTNVDHDEEQGDKRNLETGEDASVGVSLYQEVTLAIDVAVSMYGLASLRQFARQGQLYDGDQEKNAKILELPVTTFDVLRSMDENKAFLVEKLTGDAYEMYLSLVDMKREEGFDKDELKSEVIIHMDDVRSEEECVYAFAVDHKTKDLVVGFRGSVTETDWKADLKAMLIEYENPLVPEDAKEAGVPYYPTLCIHQGFREYLDGTLDAKPSALSVTNEGEGREDPITKSRRILRELASLSEQYPEYRITVSGHSLGGALATVFALDAAASADKRIRKPITCISVASPKVGNTRFLNAIEALEKTRRLRVLRVVNFGDSVTILPDPGYLNSYLRPHKVYRHVGMLLKLYPARYHFICGRLVLCHPKRYYGLVGYLDQVWRSAKHLFVWLICCPLMCLPLLPCCIANLFLVNHGCRAYIKRVEMNKGTLSGISLDDLYEKDLQIKRCKLC